MHDFPYAYKLDGNKLYCNKPDPSSPTGKCEGIIDYDPGYNFLYCTKCGKKYKAKELEVAIKENNVIVKSEGEHKMKIAITGGTHDLKKEVVTGEYSAMAKAMPSRNISSNPGKLNKGNNREQRRDNKKNYKENNRSSKQYEKKNVVESNYTAEDSSKKVNLKENITVSESPVEATITTEPEIKFENPTGITVASKSPISPISFDTSDGKEDKTEATRSNMENFEYCLVQALSVFDRSTDEEKASMFDLVKEGFKEAFEAALDEAEKEKVKEYKSKLESIKVEEVEMSNVDIAKSIYENNPEAVEEILKLAFNKGYCVINVLSNEGYNEETGFVEFNISPYIIRESDSGEFVSSDDLISKAICKSEDHDGNIAPLDMISNLNAAGYKVIPFEESVEGEIVKYYSSKIINTQDINVDNESSKVISITDENGSFLRNENGEIVIIDTIDDKAVNDLAIVSSNWLDGMIERINVFESGYDENPEVKTQPTTNIPVGVVAPNTDIGAVGVNGVVASEE